MNTVENTLKRPQPHEFSDHRQYLKAMVFYLKQTQVAFSYRYFARRAGFSSPNFLKLVAEGKRNIAPETISRFATGLGLTAKEQEAFDVLVKLGQAATDAERNLYFQRLQKIRAGASPTAQLEAAQYEVYSHWYVIPVRELMLTDGFREDPAWIARRLRPRIRPKEAQHALDLLVKTGLASRDAGGRLKPSETKLATPDNVKFLSVRNYHRAMLEIASKSLDTIPQDKRNVTSLTVALSPKQYELATRRIAAFRQELLDELEDTPADGESREIHLLGFQVVPVSGEEEK